VELTRPGLTVAAIAVAGGAAAFRRRSRRSSSDAATDRDGLTLPEGCWSSVETDDGAILQIYSAGLDNAPTIVLAHCWMGRLSLWGHVARTLVDSGHRVVLWDQRGHGESTLGRDPLTIDRLGSDLHQILTQLDLTGVVLAGHSMGGMTVQALAARYPSAVRERTVGILLAATAAHQPFRIPPRLAALVLGERRTDRMTRMRPRAAAGVLSRRAGPGRARAMHEAMVVASGPARAGFLTAMGTMDYRPDLANLAVPTKILVGSRDGLTPPRRARVLAAGIPGAELRVLPGCSHMLPLEAPEELVAALLDLVSAGGVVVADARRGRNGADHVQAPVTG
jgi:pimeloyl-ACP methyl ester carboxylesterase